MANKMVYANSADPDQTAPEGAVWSGSTLFAFLLSILRNSCIKSKIYAKRVKNNVFGILGHLLKVWGIIEPILVVWKKEFSLSHARGLQTTMLSSEDLNETKTWFSFFSNVLFLSTDSLYRFFLPLQLVLSVYVVAITNVPVVVFSLVCFSTYFLGLCIFGRYFANVYKEDNFCNFLFAILYTKPLLKRGLL